MKKIINSSIWIFSGLGMLIIMGFINNEQRNIICENVQIKIDYKSGDFFVEREDILNLIKTNGYNITGKPLVAINYEELEELLKLNSSIARAEVYSTIAGDLVIDVTQRRPILRLVGNNNRLNYYIDEEGVKMPLSDKYTSRILFANGEIKEDMLDDLFMLAKFVDKNNFWRAQIQQIHINLDGEIELIPRVGKHTIILGDVSDLDEKFNKLMLFYKNGLNKIGWNKYKTVNLKFKNQIVCTKL